MQRAHDFEALERLSGCIFGADRHQAGHFLLGKLNFFAAPIGKLNILNFKIEFHDFLRNGRAKKALKIQKRIQLSSDVV